MSNANLLVCTAVLICIFFLFSAAANAELVNPDSVTRLDGQKTVDLGKQTVSKDDSPQKQIEFHLKKGLFFYFVRGKKSEAATEFALAEQCYRAETKAGPSETLQPYIGILAAAHEILGDKQKSRQFYDELKASWPQGSKPKSDLEYARILLDFAGASIMVVDSYAVAESIAAESLHQFELAGRGKDAEAIKAQTFVGKIQQRRGENKKAISTLQKAKANCAADLNSSDACQIDALLVKAFLADGKRDEAKALCSERINLEQKGKIENEGITSIVASLADIYYQSGKNSDAEKLFEQWKQKLKDNPTLSRLLLSEFSELQSRRKQDADSFDLSEEANHIYQVGEANKRAVNAMITHYYVLKELGLYKKAELAYALETRLRRLINKSEKARELTGPPVPKEDSKQELSAAEKRKLDLDDYEVNRAFDDYKKILQQGSSPSAMADLEAIIQLFKNL